MTYVRRTVEVNFSFDISHIEEFISQAMEAEKEVIRNLVGFTRELKLDFADKSNIADILKEFNSEEFGNADECIDKIMDYLKNLK